MLCRCQLTRAHCAFPRRQRQHYQRRQEANSGALFCADEFSFHSCSMLIIIMRERVCSLELWKKTQSFAVRRCTESVKCVRVYCVLQRVGCSFGVLHIVWSVTQQTDRSTRVATTIASRCRHKALRCWHCWCCCLSLPPFQTVINAIITFCHYLQHRL